MAAKRTIPPRQTGAERRAAAVGKRYYATISSDPALPERFRVDGPARHVIAVRDEQGNVIDVKQRPNHDEPDILYEVDQLNRGTPLSRQQLGRLSVRDRVKGLGIKPMQSATEIVTRLVNPESPTADHLREIQASGGKLERSELPALIAQVTNEWKAFTDLATLPLKVADRRDGEILKFLAAVGKQLSDKYGI